MENKYYKVMSYEEKYKDALEKARAFYETKSPDCLILESIFPELAEFEDERIRKEIISIVKSYRESCITEGNHRFDDCIAWLEKQNHDGKKWIYEDVYFKEKEEIYQDGVDDVLENPQKYGLEKQGELQYWKPSEEQLEALDYAYNSCPDTERGNYYESVLRTLIDELYKLQENQGEQKPTDKVEPKFKVGEWITNNYNNYAVWCIEHIYNGFYDLKGPNGGTIKSAEIKTIDNNFHLWTIGDAEDGDVLAFDWTQDNGASHWQKIVIFKGLNKDGIEGYGNTFKNGKLVLQEEVPYYSKTWTMTLQPATKEQRDLLFQKMKEAGYTWDAEKKELIKNM